MPATLTRVLFQSDLNNLRERVQEDNPIEFYELWDHLPVVHA